MVQVKGLYAAIPVLILCSLPFFYFLPYTLYVHSHISSYTPTVSQSRSQAGWRSGIEAMVPSCLKQCCA